MLKSAYNSGLITSNTIKYIITVILILINELTKIWNKYGNKRNTFSCRSKYFQG